MEHRPLVLIGNDIHQLPLGDTVVGAIPEEEMAYAKRTDIVSDSLIYKGEAAPGTTNESPLWRISRLILSFNEAKEMVGVITTWAGGSPSATQVWNNRASLEYL